MLNWVAVENWGSRVKMQACRGHSRVDHVKGGTNPYLPHFMVNLRLESDKKEIQDLSSAVILELVSRL